MTVTVSQKSHKIYSMYTLKKIIITNMSRASKNTQDSRQFCTSEHTVHSESLNDHDLTCTLKMKVHVRNYNHDYNCITKCLSAIWTLQLV